MTLVVDASVVVAALVDGGPEGAWAEAALLEAPLVAPHLLPVEVADILRRAEADGAIGSESATLALADLPALLVDYVSFAPLAFRVLESRATLTAFDAWYVALAELLDAPLATLDRRLTRAPGPVCRFWTPETNPGVEES